MSSSSESRFHGQIAHYAFAGITLLHNLNTLPSIKHRKAETFFKSPCGNNALLNLGNLR